MWDRNSSRKYLSDVSTGFGAVCPRPQRAPPLMARASRSSLARSTTSPFPWEILSRMVARCLVPTRQGTHLPHDSAWVKFRKYLAVSTMHGFLSRTMSPPDPMMDLAAHRGSEAMG